MSLLVQKYGGTSVGSIERIEQVADKVAGFRAQGHDMVVVLSAMSGETNRLIGLAQQIQEVPDPRELDVLVSTGEQVTIALLCMALKKRGLDARSYTGGQVRILTDSSFTKARIQAIDEENMRADLKQGRVVVGYVRHRCSSVGCRRAHVGSSSFTYRRRTRFLGYFSDKPFLSSRHHGRETCLSCARKQKQANEKAPIGVDRGLG